MHTYMCMCVCVCTVLYLKQRKSFVNGFSVAFQYILLCGGKIPLNQANYQGVAVDDSSSSNGSSAAAAMLLGYF